MLKTLNPLRLVALLLLVVLALAGCSMKSGPEKALEEIRTAIETHDPVKFERYVDLDQVLGQAFDLYFATAMQELGAQDQDGFEALGASMGMAMVERMKPSLIQATKQSVLADIEDRPPPARLIEQPDMSEVYEGASTDWEVVSVKEDGPIAIVGVRYQPADSNEPDVLELKMTQECDGDWRVVQIANFEAIIASQQARDAQRAAERAEKLAALNEKTRAQMARHLAVTDHTIAVQQEALDPAILLNIELENPGSVDVAEATVEVDWRDGDGEEVRSGRLGIDALPAGEKDIRGYKFSVNPFYDPRLSLYNDLIKERAVTVETRITRVVLADGTTLEERETLPAADGGEG